MEVVIDIPQIAYEIMKINVEAGNLLCHMSEKEIVIAIAKGVLLPKRHGRLGDLDFVANRIKAKPPIGEIGKVTLEECYQEILQAATIIEKSK